MKVRNVNYPYPVLSEHNDDYINSRFEVIYSNAFIDGEHYINVDVVLKNPQLLLLLEKKLADLILHIECPYTSQRKIKKFNNLEYTFKIDPDLFSGYIELTMFIITNTFFKEYSNVNINPKIFGNNYIVYNLEKGSILASSLSQTVKIESDDYHDNVASIIKVGLNTDSDDLHVEYDQNFILIKLPIEKYEIYKSSGNKRYNELVLSSLIYPVLIYIIELMSRAEFFDYAWYNVLLEKLKEYDIGVGDINKKVPSYKIASKILHSPVIRALESIKEED